MPTPMTPRRDLEAKVDQLDAALTAKQLEIEQLDKERRRWFQEAQHLARQVQQLQTQVRG